MTTMMTRTHAGTQVITQQGRADAMSRFFPQTWQECHEELARRDIDPTRRAAIELTLENIRRGSW